MSQSHKDCRKMTVTTLKKVGTAILEFMRSCATSISMSEFVERARSSRDHVGLFARLVGCIAYYASLSFTSVGSVHRGVDTGTVVGLRLGTVSLHHSLMLPVYSIHHQAIVYLLPHKQLSNQRCVLNHLTDIALSMMS
jgi:hypothetical protein